MCNGQCTPPKSAHRKGEVLRELESLEPGERAIDVVKVERVEVALFATPQIAYRRVTGYGDDVDTRRDIT